MTVLCKFQCWSKELAYKHYETDPDRYQIKLGAVWEGSQELQAKSENAIFGEATPSGGLQMLLVNLDAAAYFEVGQQYYLTLEKAPPAENFHICIPCG